MAALVAICVGGSVFAADATLPTPITPAASIATPVMTTGTPTTAAAMTPVPTPPSAPATTTAMTVPATADAALPAKTATPASVAAVTTSSQPEPFYEKAYDKVISWFKPAS